MSLAAKMSRIRYEATERRYHESLYTNLCLLSQRHPPSKQLENVLSNDMFRKSNKVAFFHVIHYLFKTLDAELTKAKITSFDPYDLESEQTFRSEVMNYLGVLRDSYKDCNIPTITNSHLISPGGFKFARFMFSVSQLVLVEDLKKMKVVKLNCPKKECSKEHKENFKKSITINPLQSISNLIVDETKKIESECEIYLNESEKTNKKIVSLLPKLDLELNEKQILYEQLKHEFTEKYPSCPSLSSLQEKFLLMKQERERFLVICDTFIACQDLIQLITSPATTLEYKNEHDSNNSDCLNLVEFFKNSIHLIKQKALDLPCYSSPFLEENKNALRGLIDEYLNVYNELQENQEKFQKLIEQIPSGLKHLL